MAIGTRPPSGSPRGESIIEPLRQPNEASPLTAPRVPDPVSVPGVRATGSLRRWLRKVSLAGLIGIGVVVTVLLVGLLANWISPHSPYDQDLATRLRPPAWESGDWTNPLGTDALGRDVLSRVLYGARISVLIGVSAAGISLVVGLTLGLLAGYFGSTLDALVMRLTEIQLSIPFLVLTLGIMAVFGPGLRNVIIVLGLVGWVPYARVVRSQVLSMREREFVQASRALGASTWRILTRSLLPNVVGTCTVIGTLEVARMILTEAALSFLGLGVAPPTPAWGSMIADGRNYLYVAWWITVFPGVAIFITILGINLFGDWMRDYFDPKLRI